MNALDRLVPRLRAMKPSATVELSERAAALAKLGNDVIALAAGEPDFPPPSSIVKRTKKALDKGFTHYTSSMGLAELRATIAQKLAGDNGLTYDPAKEILVTPGAKQGLAYAFMAFLDTGDELLCPEPGWVSYREITLLAGGTYVPIPLDPNDNYRLTKESLERHASDRSRILVLNSPCNPTGRVLDAAELQAAADFAIARDLLVISDEIYEKLVFDDHKHVSIASLPGMQERTLLLNGFSKVYAMTGYRLGYLAGPAAIIKELNKLQQHTATCPTAFAQAGAIDSYEPCKKDVERMVKQFKKRRKLLVKSMAGIPGVKPVVPEGSFYMWLDCRGLGLDSFTLSRRLLEEGLLALTPGAAFGQCGEGFLRLSFACSEETLEKAVSRLRTVATKIHHESR